LGQWVIARNFLFSIKSLTQCGGFFVANCFTKIKSGVIITNDMDMTVHPGGRHEDGVWAKVVDITPYLPGATRFELDSNPPPTAQDSGAPHGEYGPITVFDPHLRADLLRMEDIAGKLDPQEAIAGCVGFVRKLLEETEEGVTPEVDFAQVKGALGIKPL
jgi:hypothetical protein